MKTTNSNAPQTSDAIMPMRYSVMGGTGELGRAIATRLAAVGYEVWIGSRDATRAQATADELAAATGGHASARHCGQ